MEAPGHEFIENEMAHFVENLLNYYGIDKKNKSCLAIHQKYFAKEKKHLVNRAYYLGNWLTDNSQIFVPDTYFDIKYNMPTYAQKINNKVIEAHSSINNFINNDLGKNKVVAKFFKKELQQINEYSNSFFKMPLATAKMLTKLNYPKVNKNEFEFDLRYGKNGKQDEWWLVSQSMLKLLGYHKFCMKHTAKENMPTQKPISNQLYMDIVSSFIDQDANAPKNKPFKLNQYYPSDHLDRGFDIEYLKVEAKKQQFVYRQLDILEQDKTISNENKAKRIEDINKDESKRRNCYDDKYTNSSCIYDYLKDYKHIMATKLNYLTASFIKPVFLEGEPMTENDFLINMARLGHSMHGIEDFFAHSNFIELIVSNLNELNKKMDDNSIYFTQAKFFEEISKKDYYEKGRFERAELKAIRDHKQNAKTIEPNLTTGIFAETDTFTSVYHMIFGNLESELEDIFDGNVITDNPFVIAMQYFMENLKGYIEDYDKDNLEATYKIAIGEEKPFTLNLVRFILNRHPVNNNVSDKEKRILENVSDELLEYIVDLLNQLYGAVKLFGLTIIPILAVVQLFLTILFAPLALVFFFKNVLKIFGFQLYIKPLIKDFLTKKLNEKANKIEIQDLELSSPLMRGTHSVIAKDESYRNENFNYQAKRMALFMDKYILLNMFFGSDNKENKQCDFTSVLNNFLTHPFPNKLKSAEEIKKENELFGVYSTVNVIDIVSNELIAISIEQIFNLGVAYNTLITKKSINDYSEEFLKLNGDFIKPEYLNFKDNPILLTEKSREFKDLKFIILPFQKMARDYEFSNGRIKKESIMLNEVLITNSNINKNKMWMMQFFVKDNYQMFVDSGSFLKRMKNLLLSKKPEDNIDEIDYTKEMMIFNKNIKCITELSNPSSIVSNVLIFENAFSFENEVKLNYQKFIENFIKIHYK